jgi:hypothetical protein
LSVEQVPNDKGGHGAEIVECAFLIPVVRDGDRRPHRPSCWKALQDALYDTFSGYSGPETWFRVYRTAYQTAGEYESESRARVQDRSRRYVVAVPRQRLDELGGVLRRAASTFDQEAVYLSVAGVVEFVRGTEEDTGLF